MERRKLAIIETDKPTMAATNLFELTSADIVNKSDYVIVQSSADNYERCLKAKYSERKDLPSYNQVEPRGVLVKMVNENLKDEMAS